MNMGGIGSKMMRHVMKEKNVDSLELLREQAIQNGVEFIACQMSMDVMGITREELLDNRRRSNIYEQSRAGKCKPLYLTVLWKRLKRYA